MHAGHQASRWGRPAGLTSYLSGIPQKQKREGGAKVDKCLNMKDIFPFIYQTAGSEYEDPVKLRNLVCHYVAILSHCLMNTESRHYCNCVSVLMSSGEALEFCNFPGNIPMESLVVHSETSNYPLGELLNYPSQHPSE